MAGSHERSQVLRFGIFEVDQRARELRRRGIRVRLQEQPFLVLAYLLERAGEVVTRDELRQRLWPSSVYVDFDHGLNNAIARLREALGDAAGTPRFVETLPRLGYRFICPIGVSLPSLKAAQVFLSYVAEDRTRVEPLVRAIEASGLSVWWDRRIDMGSSFDVVVERELDAAGCIVVVWSTHSVGSEWVRNEASEGAARGILVQVQIDDVRPPLAFRRMQAARLVAWPEGSHAEALDELIEGIRGVVARRSNASSEQPEQIVVAVLPLADRSPERNLAYLCEGLAEDLMNALFAIDGLRVLAATDTFAFKDSTAGTGEIGASLGATVVLEGSVQRAGDRLAISVRLVEVSTGVTMYAERFVRPSQDVLDLQAEIVRYVVDGMRAKLGLRGIAPLVVESRPRDPGAFELYSALRDPANVISRVVSGSPLVLRLIAALECIISLDPAFERAYADLARLYLNTNIGWDCFSSTPDGYSAASHARAKALLAQLEARNPNNPFAWDIRARLESDMSVLAEKCHSMILRRDRIYPYAHPTGLQDVRNGYARALAHSGLHAPAFEYFEQIDRADEPNHFDALAHAVGCLVACREFERAFVMCRRVFDLFGPDSYMIVPTWEVVAHLALNDLDGAAAVPQDPNDFFHVGFTQPLLSARRDGTRIEDADRFEFAEMRGYALLSLGEIDRGFVNLTRGIETAGLDRHWVGFRLPIFRALFPEGVKRDSRYPAVLASLHLDVESREKMRTRAAELTSVTGVAAGPLLDL